MIEYKTLWEKEKLLVMSNLYFSHKVLKSCLLLMRQNEDLWSKELNLMKMVENSPKVFEKLFCKHVKTLVYVGKD